MISTDKISTKSEVNIDNRIVVSNWMMLLIFITILSFLIIVSKDTFIAILSFFIVTITVMVKVRFDLLHPFTWFVPLYMLYSISYPLLVHMGEAPDNGYTFQVISLEWFALIAFIITIGPKKREIKSIKVPIRNFRLILQIILIITFLFTCIYVLYIYLNGLSSKYEISLSNSVFIKFGAFFSIFTLVYAIFISNEMINNKKLPVKIVVLTTIWIVLAFLISGERDFLYRHVLITIFLIDTVYKKIPKVKLAIYGVIGMLSIPILGGLKNVLVSNKGLEPFTLPTFSEILSGEFISASRNLLVLLTNSNQWDFFMGETIWWDFKRVFVPQFLLNSEVINPVGWFNNSFYMGLVSRGGGQGFTMVGEGYMNFGLIGVMIWFMILGLIIKLLYLKSSKNILYLVSYIAFIPIVIYSIRADLSNLLSPLFSQIIIPILIMLILRSILGKDVTSSKVERVK
ncbi:O-antigen polymerase [Paenibacillus chungangensis]|uniref:O-antigen polymerase n=1 Tax=Paenibacillus chungangensis TaxID=696535 RepID=A0ABW3HVX9_9BACL